MIDEKVLIERLEKLENKWRYIFFKEREQNGKTFASEYAEGKRFGITEIIKIVKELAEEHNNGWISVEDALPSVHGKYLVTCEDISIPQIRLFEGEWDSISKVIAWQPLPAPYKKGE